jgi:hypothetical protein
MRGGAARAAARSAISITIKVGSHEQVAGGLRMRGGGEASRWRRGAFAAQANTSPFAAAFGAIRWSGCGSSWRAAYLALGDAENRTSSAV